MGVMRLKAEAEPGEKMAYPTYLLSQVSSGEWRRVEAGPFLSPAEDVDKDSGEETEANGPNISIE